MLYAMQILDVLAYVPSPRGIGALTRSLLHILYHPRSLADILPELTTSSPEPTVATQTRHLISVGSLCPGTGCTQLVFHLACCLDPDHPVLMVEMSPKPVLSRYFLNPTDRNTQTGLYSSPSFRQTGFLPDPAPVTWERHRQHHPVTLVDLGLLDTNDKFSLFLRSDLALLVTTGSAWHIQDVLRRKEEFDSCCLWINFCPPDAFSDYVQIFGSSFRGYYAGRYAPDPLRPGREQAKLIRTLLKQQHLTL